MSDWLQQLSELEQREAQATEEKWYVVGPPWGDGGFVVAGDPDPHVGRYVCNTDDLLIMDDEEAKEHGASNKLADAEFIAAFRNSASDLIERARRAQELERENQSRYSDREAFLADANLMIQEKTRIMHEVQELTTQMPPAALKFMGYALIDAGRNP